MKKAIASIRKSNKPSFTHIIEKKRDGEELTKDELRFVIDSIAEQEASEHQLAALLMCIYFRGMSAQETAVLCEEVMLSGEVIDLSSLSKPKIDHYCLGGVGNKSSLVLGPLVAACGVAVPCMVGEEEDYLITSLQKAASIPGFQSNLTVPAFIQQLKTVHCALVAQPAAITPVDHTLYRMRQEIGIIPSLPLVTASILSKKLSSGTEGLVVDVKWGHGSFIKEVEQAKQLARAITRTARSMNRRCVALVTDMNQPLGDSVGFSLEVKEALMLLRGEGPEDLKDLIMRMGMEIVRMAGVAGSTLAAKQIIQRHFHDGSAFEKFKEMVKAQGGEAHCLDNPDLLPQAKHCRKLSAPKRGYVHAVHAGHIAKGVQLLATRADGSLDLSVGVSEIRKIGTQVKQGEPLMMVHYNDEANLETALEEFKNAYRLAPKRPNPIELVVERMA